MSTWSDRSVPPDRGNVRGPDAADVRGVAIADVSSILGVPLPTLRSWEQRYGLPAMSHDRGRHRRYLPVQVHAIRLMRDAVARGEQAGPAAAKVHRLLRIGGDAGVIIHDLLEASEHPDAHGIRRALDDAAGTLGLANCVDDVLLPAMRQVGLWWEIGHCDVGQERTTTASVRAWLDRCMAFAPAPAQPRPILLACGPSDLHTIGLEAMAALLRERGWSCRILGAHTPTATVVTATRATGAAAVVLVSQLATGRRQAVESICAVHRIRVPVFYAGTSFNARTSRVGVPGQFLGNRIQDACSQVIGAVTQATGTSAAG